MVPEHDVTDELERKVATDFTATVEERELMLAALRAMRRQVRAAHTRDLSRG